MLILQNIPTKMYMDLKLQCILQPRKYNNYFRLGKYMRRRWFLNQNVSFSASMLHKEAVGNMGLTVRNMAKHSEWTYLIHLACE